MQIGSTLEMIPGVSFGRLEAAGLVDQLIHNAKTENEELNVGVIRITARYDNVREPSFTFESTHIDY